MPVYPGALKSPVYSNKNLLKVSGS